jgi:predicted HAD superfamily phosphohydrolase YqeG
VDEACGVSAGNPKDRQIECILRDYGLPPSEVVLVGDSDALQDHGGHHLA